MLEDTKVAMCISFLPNNVLFLVASWRPAWWPCYSPPPQRMGKDSYRPDPLFLQLMEVTKKKAAITDKKLILNNLSKQLMFCLAMI